MQLETLLRRGAPLAALALTNLPASAHVRAYEVLGTAASHLGSSVARAGDVDGDGVNDVLVGAPLAFVNGAQSGQARVISGRDGSLLFTFSSGVPGDEFGAAVSAAGDVDQDGYADVLVGAPGYDSGRGKVLLYSGRTGFALHLWGGQHQGARYGAAIELVGFVDADFRADWVVSAPYETTPNHPNWGRLRVYSGATQQVILDVVHPDSTSGSNWGFGLALAGRCDWNGDGVSDLLVGSPLYDGPGTLRGLAQVYSGADGSLLRTWKGQDGEMLGSSIAGIGDVDGDGLSDVAIGVPGSALGGNDSGRVDLYGITSATTPIFTVQGPAGSRFGSAVSRCDDANGDAVPDFLVGAPEHALPILGAYGAVSVRSGVGGASLGTIYGTQLGCRFGAAVDWLGDLNGDGADDFVVGAPLFDGATPAQGQATVVLTGAVPPTSFCSAKTNSRGCEPSITAAGAPSLSMADNFHVSASNVLNHTPGILIYGFSPDSKPFGGGTLCIHAPVVRTPVQFSGGNPGALDCSGSYDFLFSRNYMATRGFAPGLTVYCQYWSRDPGYPQPTNIGLTDALEFHVLP